MTDLVDSLLEFSWTREALRPILADANDAVENAVEAVRAHPEFHRVSISVSSKGKTAGWFDAKKLERVLYNLLLNACEIVPKDSGHVAVELTENTAGLEIRIADNGPGIPVAIRERLFDPFVTHGKETGSGLGLAVAQKIVQDHGGEILVEKTSGAGTTFKVTIPLHSGDGSLPAGQKVGGPVAAGAKPAPSA